jgi:hypothetical protein
MRTDRLITTLVVSLALCGSLFPGTAGAQSLDLDPALSAKVAKEKAKARATEQGKGPASSADKTVVTGKDDCGVNIGNVDTSRAGPGKPIGSPRENTVVITGPVINLGKCK